MQNAKEKFYKVTVYQPITYIVKANDEKSAIEMAKDKAAWHTFSMPECFDVQYTTVLSEDKVKQVESRNGDKVYEEVKQK